MFELIQQTKTNNSNTNSQSLQLCPILINDDYRKEWNIRLNDFVCISKNGELLRPNLYRVGGFNNPNLGKDKYFMLLKYFEAFYPDDILKMSKDKNPKHLASGWCILDKDGNEKINFEEFKSPYLVENSCLYTLNNYYFNIETGEQYGSASKSMESSDFLFLDKTYNIDKNGRGIMKINKKDGTWELLK